MLKEAIKLALQTIFRNRLRSFLTLLGVVIGVAAVIAMVTIGNGTTEKVRTDIAKLGTNMLSIHPGQGGRGPRAPGGAAQSFDSGDVTAIRNQVHNIVAVAPAVTQRTTAINGNGNWHTTVWGSNNDFFRARGWSFNSGRSFSAVELRFGKSVCIIGETVRSKLFGNSNPIGQKIRLTKLSCEIIGLLSEKGQSSVGADQDDLVVMPLRTAQRRITGKKEIDMIFISVSSSKYIEKVKKSILYLMRDRRHIFSNDDDDFHVRGMKELITMRTGTTQMLTGLLSMVAAVSLLVGGIGIMNIMLVSVTERTREIGIRLAIGALESQVLVQFLVEAVVLSLIGGLIGIIIGLSLAFAAVSVLEVPFVFNLNIIIIAFLFSVFVGIIFGYFPARRAASLDPIEALRHE